MTDTNMVEWVLNGKRVSSPAGMTILEASREHSVGIPHFCYHPGLSISGNCRMCLVETNRSPKPAISCSERISPDLEVKTHSEMAVEARNGVMEFELINHPLDCPVCDKAGECVLQDYSYLHGPDRSRFHEDKNVRHTKRLGPSIEIWGNRCIVCTRCVRFCEEISGTSELCVVERGDRSVVDVFPGIPIDNALAGNTIDICPVGALIGSDFKYEARVWYMDRTPSVCAGCARGCNIDVHDLDGYVKRLTPRENRQVNDWWMCDHGRYDWRYAHADERVREFRHEGDVVSETEAYDHLAELIRSAREGKKKIAFLVDPFLTCEEAHLVRAMAGSSQIAGWTPPTGVSESFPNGFTISATKAPNQVGMEAVLGKEVFSSASGSLRKDLESGKVDLLVVFAGFPHGDAPQEWKAGVKKASKRVAFSLFDGFWTDGANIVLPAASPFEKDGTWANEDGRLQRVRTSVKPGTSLPGTRSVQDGDAGGAIRPPSMLRPLTDLGMIQEIQLRLGDRTRLLSSTGVFRELASDNEAFAGLTHRDIPADGAPLPGFSRTRVGSGGDA